jgi:hypothetical protein
VHVAEYHEPVDKAKSRECNSAMPEFGAWDDGCDTGANSSSVDGQFGGCNGWLGKIKIDSKSGSTSYALNCIQKLEPAEASTTSTTTR